MSVKQKLRLACVFLAALIFVYATASSRGGHQLLESEAAKNPISEAGYSIVSTRDWQLAMEYAPVFMQETGPPIALLPPFPPPGAPPIDREEEKDRVNYITRVDYDGNWIAYDNWNNFYSPNADFRAYVYFSTAETLTHFYAYYTVFHPRDVGSIHENDLEGAMVVVEKKGGPNQRPRLLYVQTLAHNVFFKYYNPEFVTPKPGIPLLDKLLLEGNHPLIYIEPRGHGIRGYEEPPKIPGLPPKRFIIYRCKGYAEDPRKVGFKDVGYDLIPAYSTLWKAALLDPETNATFTDFRNYGEFDVEVAPGALAPAKQANAAGNRLHILLKTVGASLIGKFGRPNAAHPPWGWSLDGRWFFLPAEETKKDFFLGDDFSLAYVHHPFLGIYRSKAGSTSPQRKK